MPRLKPEHEDPAAAAGAEAAEHDEEATQAEPAKAGQRYGPAFLFSVRPAPSLPKLCVFCTTAGREKHLGTSVSSTRVTSSASCSLGRLLCLGAAQQPLKLCGARSGADQLPTYSSRSSACP